jgi:hypothetical protein
LAVDDGPFNREGRTAVNELVIGIRYNEQRVVLARFKSD